MANRAAYVKAAVVMSVYLDGKGGLDGGGVATVEVVKVDKLVAETLLVSDWLFSCSSVEF